MLVYIIPTYECNFNCKSCYSKKYLEMFPEYLSWKGFINIYNTFKSELNRAAFIGGEATQWKFINEAILFLENKNIKTTLFSNGTKIINAMPNHVVVNGSNLFNNDLSDGIMENILLYKRRNVRITLRFNIDEYFESHILDAVNIAKSCADSVSISALFPVKTNNKTVGQLIYETAKALASNQIKTKISRATPLCLFTVTQKEYLENICGLKGKCSLPSKSIIVNPDGISVQPCVELPIMKNIFDFSQISANSIYKEEIDALNRKVSGDCEECDLFKIKKCCGGCLAYK